ncbi:hypothetical protein LBMAG53_31150 [Planctomycetota bacterium]|nr:hypothetical protein LBMAG53_31150 [Planctomycetota bacterium]
MGHHDQVTLFLALAVLLAAARLLGEAARRWQQPAVLGEILAGVLLGPTILGHVWPEAFHHLFQPGAPSTTALNGIAVFAVTLFMLVAGIEMELQAVLRRGGTALAVSICGTVIPFILGFVMAWFAPDLMGAHIGADRLTFALLAGTAMSITALPVIAKTLRDLHLYRSDLGMVVMSAATVGDFLGWLLFAVVLAMAGHTGHDGPGLVNGLLLAVAFVAGTLTAGRWAIHRALPWVQAYLSFPGGVLGFVGVLALAGAAFSSWIGLHAVFGAFIVGIALGDSPHLRPGTRATIDQVVSFLFVPLFFASIGLKVDFYAHFDLLLVAVVLVVACAGKIAGSYLGAKLSGSGRRESLAIGVCMNARGAMEIILALVALEAKLIDERLFVALVVMAVVTSVLPGPLLARIIPPVRTRRFTAYLSPKSFLPRLAARTAEDAITELCSAVGSAGGRDAAGVAGEVLRRERMQATGTGDGLAIPHARLDGLTAPIVALGLAPEGIDFAGPDGRAAQIVVLVLTPDDDDATQLELLADIARIFSSAQARSDTLAVKTHTELLAHFQIERHATRI